MLNTKTFKTKDILNTKAFKLNNKVQLLNNKASKLYNTKNNEY